MTHQEMIASMGALLVAETLEHALTLLRSHRVALVLVGPTDATHFAVMVLRQNIPPTLHVMLLPGLPQDVFDLCLLAGALPAPHQRFELEALVRAQLVRADQLPLAESHELSLPECERRFRLFSENMPFIVWSAQPDGQLDYANSLFYELTNASPAKTLTQSWLEAIHPEDQAQARSLWRTQLPRHVHLRLYTPQGTPRWHNIFTVPIFNERGQCVRWLSAALDVHEQRSLEEQARVAAERLSSTLEGLTDGFIILSADLVVHYVNTTAQRLLERAREALLEQHILKLCPSLIPTRFEHTCYEVLSTQTPATLELPWGASDGWVELRVLPSDHGLALSLHDITARRRAARQLRLLNVCIDHLNDIVLIIDEPKQGQPPSLIYANEAFSRITGYSQEQLARALEQPNPPPSALNGWRDTLLAPCVCRKEIHYNTKENVELWLDTDMLAVRDEGGVITHWVAIQRDVTDYKRAQMIASRAQRVESLGTFAGRLAHDLNNLIAPILSITATLKSSNLSTEQLDELDIIDDCAKHSAALIRKVLDFSRGAPDNAREMISMTELVRELGRLLREVLPPTIELELNIPHVACEVYGERDQLHELLLNLCFNARDAMSSGGRLTIRLRLATFDKVHSPPHIQHIGVYIVVEVEDNGIGISAKQLEHIFEPFYTTKTNGQGFGLATCNSIAHGHSGFILVRSAPGAGSCFSVYVPAYQRSATVVERCA